MRPYRWGQIHVVSSGVSGCCYCGALILSALLINWQRPRIETPRTIANLSGFREVQLENSVAYAVWC